VIVCITIVTVRSCQHGSKGIQRRIVSRVYVGESSECRSVDERGAKVKTMGSDNKERQ
jgi:hypothetical protein